MLKLATFISRKRAILIPIATIILLLSIQSVVNNSSAHEVREIETIYTNIEPHLVHSTSGPSSVTIEKDSTTINLGSITGFTTQNVLVGYFNFSDSDLDYDGMEAYKAILHQTIHIVDLIDGGLFDEMELGTRIEKLSNSVLHDSSFMFIFSLADLDDFSWIKVVGITEFIHLKEFVFKIHNSIEFVRGTKQNASFTMHSNLESYISADIPTDYFHYKQIMNTTTLPNQISISEGSIFGARNRVYLFLPDEMLPKYFTSPEGHSLNLTEVPLTIRLRLDLKSSSQKHLRQFTIQSEDQYSKRTDRKDNSEDFLITVYLSNSPLIPITIDSMNYEGDVELQVALELKSLFADTSLYAKNQYPMSPNQYIMIMATTATIFIYKLVDYVEYRGFQNQLAQKNHGLVEEEFIS